jgi:hypothetical protein
MPVRARRLRGGLPKSAESGTDFSCRINDTIADDVPDLRHKLLGSEGSNPSLTDSKGNDRKSYELTIRLTMPGALGDSNLKTPLIIQKSYATVP